MSGTVYNSEPELFFFQSGHWHEVLVLQARSSRITGEKSVNTRAETSWRDHMGQCCLTSLVKPQPRDHRVRTDAAALDISKRGIFLAARIAAQGQAASVSEARQQRQYIRKMIQSVRLPRQRVLFHPFNRLFVFVWRFTRPVRELPLFSPTQIRSCCRRRCASEAYSSPII